MKSPGRLRWRGARLIFLIAAFLPAIAATLIYAQVGGAFDLSWSTIDGGGGTFSTGGPYNLGGTAGQFDAGTQTGSPYTLLGGFWGVTVQAVLVGHVTWQGPPPQPNPAQQLPITLTLCLAGTNGSYAATTDASGFFTVTTNLPSGQYNWRSKGPKYLATTGALTLVGGGSSHVEMGTENAGDVDSTHDNIVSSVDFITLKSVFGTVSTIGDLNNDGVTSSADFTLLKGSFGFSGAPANCP